MGEAVDSKRGMENSLAVGRRRFPQRYLTTASPIAGYQDREQLQY